MTTKQTLSKLRTGTVFWLGTTPTERRVRCEARGGNGDGSISFWVLNGAWSGKLYEQGDKMFIVDERGTQHDSVHLVHIEPPVKPAALSTSPNDNTPF